MPTSAAIAPPRAVAWPHAFDRVTVGSTFAALKRFATSDSDLVILRRPVPSMVTTMLTTWVASEPGLFVGPAPRGAWDLVLRDLPAGPARTWLARDLARLTAALRAGRRGASVKATFGEVATDQCRKFHVDNVDRRLITTYVGPGTEWVPAAAVDRTILAAPPIAIEAANRAIVRTRAAVQRAASGDVLIMRGLRGGGAARALVHRSPPIEHLGLRRVVLTLTLDA
jgi:hypothetical protein